MRLSARSSLAFLIGTAVIPPASPAQSGPAVADFRSADSLALERTPCLGRCPVYRVILARSGHVRLEPGINRGYPDYATVPAPVRFDSIAPAQFEQLISAALAIRFDTLPPSIQAVSALCDTAYTDASTAIVTIWMPDASKSVRHYRGCKRSPKNLRRFEDYIDEITGAGAHMRPRRPPSPPSPHN